MALFLVARALVPETGDAALFRIVASVAAALATAGCFAAATGFARDDYLRTAWYTNAISYGLVFLSAALRIPDPPLAMVLTRGALTFVNNALGIVSMWLFARAYHVAGIDLPGSRAKKIAVGATAAVLAVAIAGKPLLDAAHDLAGGNLGAIIGLSSSAGDIATFALIAPIFMTALALRGGLLVWPWSLITASNVAWLLYDAQSLVADFLPTASARTVEGWGEMWRVVACTLTLAAGLAQRRLTTAAPERAP
jgi:hypothetical protein